MRGAVPPLPKYAFMARGSVEAVGKIYLYIYLIILNLITKTILQEK
jgi:hypothetical protein